MCAVGTCGLHGWAMTETPAAQKRGSSAAPGFVAQIPAGSRRRLSSNGRPSFQTARPRSIRHAPAAAGLAARVRPRPGLEREPAGLAPGVDAVKLALEPLHRRHHLLLKGSNHSSARAGRTIAGFAGASRRLLVNAVEPEPRDRRSTCSTGVSGATPWPRLKMWARVAKPLSVRSTASSSALPPGDQRQRVEIALQREPARQSGAGDARLDRRVESDGGHPRHVGEFRQLGRCAARENDDRRPRRLCPHGGDKGRDRRDAPALEFGRRQDARPGIENLHSFRAGGELTHTDIQPRRRRGGRGVQKTVLALGKQRAAPAPGRACRARRSCSWRRSRARRRTRSALHRSAAPTSAGRAFRTQARASASPAPHEVAPERTRRRSDRAAGRRRLRTRPFGRARPGRRGYPRRESPRRSRNGGPAAASPRRPGRASSRSRERSERGRGSRDIRGGSGRPGA